MGQPWIPWYVGDYLKDTSHLSLEEHGAYLLLMSHYYTTMRPLPANLERLYRMCRCQDDKDRVAVRSVLEGFFQHDDEVYRHKRVDAELAKQAEYKSGQSKAGKKGAARRWHSDPNGDPINDPTGNPNGVSMAKPQPQSQSNSHSDSEKTSSGKPEVDPRHVPIRDFIKSQYVAKFEHECPWDGSEAKSLKLLLDSIPTWNLDQLKDAVVNHFNSQDVAPDRPRMWLSNLSSYAGGPLDRFNKKPNGVNSNGAHRNKAEQRQSDNLAARDEARRQILAGG